MDPNVSFHFAQGAATEPSPERVDPSPRTHTIHFNIFLILCSQPFLVLGQYVTAIFINIIIAITPFVFGRSLVQVSIQRPAIPTDFSCGFLQSL
jgi:hypothetical protein